MNKKRLFILTAVISLTAGVFFLLSPTAKAVTTAIRRGLWGHYGNSVAITSPRENQVLKVNNKTDIAVTINRKSTDMYMVITYRKTGEVYNCEGGQVCGRLVYLKKVTPVAGTSCSSFDNCEMKVASETFKTSFTPKEEKRNLYFSAYLVKFKQPVAYTIDQKLKIPKSVARVYAVENVRTHAFAANMVEIIYPRPLQRQTLTEMYTYTGKTISDEAKNAALSTLKRMVVYASSPLKGAKLIVTINKKTDKCTSWTKTICGTIVYDKPISGKVNFSVNPSLISPLLFTKGEGYYINAYIIAPDGALIKKVDSVVIDDLTSYQ